MADDLDLQRADHVADEADAVHRRARRHQRRRHRQKRVTSADRIDDILGERRNRMDDAAPLERHAAVLALRDDDLRAIDTARRSGGAQYRRRLDTRSLTASRASGASMQT